MDTATNTGGLVTVTVPVNEDGPYEVPDGFAVREVVSVTAEVRDADGNLVPQEG